jgi:hypothetical protein
MKAGNGEVCAIILDERHLHLHDKTRYLIYLQRDLDQVLWKAVDDMPCLIEFDCNF